MMNRREIAMTATVALGTMLMILAVVMPSSLDAAGAGPGLKPENKTPTLTVGDLAVTLKPQHNNYGEGEKPVVDMTARNPGSKPVQATVTVSMQTAEVESMLSRTMPMPVQVFSKEYPLALEPGQTQTIAIAVDKALEAGKRVTFLLSTPGSPPAPAPAPGSAPAPTSAVVASPVAKVSPALKRSPTPGSSAGNAPARIMIVAAGFMVPGAPGVSTGNAAPRRLAAPPTTQPTKVVAAAIASRN